MHHLLTLNLFIAWFFNFSKGRHCHRNGENPKQRYFGPVIIITKYRSLINSNFHLCVNVNNIFIVIAITEIVMALAKVVKVILSNYHNNYCRSLET